METSAAVSTNTCVCCGVMAALSTIDMRPWVGFSGVKEPSLFRTKYCCLGGLGFGLGVVVVCGIPCCASIERMYLHSSVVCDVVLWYMHGGLVWSLLASTGSVTGFGVVWIVGKASLVSLSYLVASWRALEFNAWMDRSDSYWMY